MHLTKLTAMLAALLVGTAAAAEPVVVEYFVDQKAFKAALATDALTFELFSDDQCSVSLGGQYQQFVGDTTLQYYVDKTHRVKGALKKPKAVRIRAVIDGPTSTSAPYLMMTGPGVTPIGGACQLQAGSPVSGSGPSGPVGPMGPQGALGPAGVDGSDGGAGPAGADGATGDAGPSGPQGPAGADGAPGDAGPSGPQGPAGADGAPGAEGPMGPQGPAGADGAPGAEGPMGPQGPEGPQGLAGADGAPGAEGPLGPQGPEGPQGLAGADGAGGAPGAEGPMGPVGPQGPAGADGADGSASFVVEAEVSLFDDGGAAETTTLGSAADRVCFLTTFQMIEVDATGEAGLCDVSSDGTDWSLTSGAGAGNSQVTCAARCLSW